MNIVIIIIFVPIFFSKKIVPVKKIKIDINQEFNTIKYYQF